MPLIQLTTATLDTDTLRSALAEPPKAKGGLEIYVERPKEGETYYFISGGEVHYRVWYLYDVARGRNMDWSHYTFHRTRASSPNFEQLFRAFHYMQ